MTALLDHYRPFFTELGQRAVGTITAPFLEATNEAGESRSATSSPMRCWNRRPPAAAGGAQVALWNNGGIRADLIGQPAAPASPATVTFAQAFDGAAVRQSRRGANRDRRRADRDARDRHLPGVARLVVQVDPTRPRRERVDRASITLGGRAIDPAARFRVATSDFIWNGGDGVVVESSEPLDAGSDIDLFVAYFEKHSPVRPGPVDRITRKR